MIETIQSKDSRRRVREVLDRVRMKRELVIVQSHDTPQAVIIPYVDYEAYREWRAVRAQQQAWLAELHAIAQEVNARASLTEPEVAALIDEARSA